MNAQLKSLIETAARRVGYDKTHITRVVAYREIDAWLDTLPCEKLDSLEISAGWKWRDPNWGSYREMNWPDHDICHERLDDTFDIIIADNVWEHLPCPYRAARHVYDMLRPTGRLPLPARSLRGTTMSESMNLLKAASRAAGTALSSIRFRHFIISTYSSTAMPKWPPVRWQHWPPHSKRTLMPMPLRPCRSTGARLAIIKTRCAANMDCSATFTRSAGISSSG